MDDDKTRKIRPDDDSQTLTGGIRPFDSPDVSETKDGADDNDETLTGGSAHLNTQQSEKRDRRNGSETLFGGIREGFYAESYSGKKVDEPETLTGGMIGIPISELESMSLDRDSSSRESRPLSSETPDRNKTSPFCETANDEQITFAGEIHVEDGQSEADEADAAGETDLAESEDSMPDLSESGEAEQTVTLIEGAPSGAQKKRCKIPEWEIGQIIDNKYKVLGFIGRGGMGSVHHVRHLNWGIDMAVKMPLGSLAEDENTKDTFVREAQVWVDLGLHPNIVQCWYVRELAGIPRLFMDYLKGGTLRTWMKKGSVKPGEWRKIIHLAIQACDGLGYAHLNGVVHRDVKPANMIMTRDGRLCVSDFGLVKVMGASEGVSGQKRDEGGSGSSESTRSVMGTPEYGAPEQWKGDIHVDARADIYSLGVILYEMCCGRRPFDDGVYKEPPMILVGRHRYSPAPDPRKLKNDIAEPLAELILQCLEKDPSDRPQTMTVLRKSLADIHHRITEKPYLRPIPEAADLRADSLNNKAVSLWDLGKRKDAQATLEKALQCDPQHLEASRNIGVIQWETGKITDQTFLERFKALESVQGRRSAYWGTLGEIHYCRGDFQNAEACLDRALKLDPDEKRTKAVIDVIHSRKGEQDYATGVVTEIGRHPEAVVDCSMHPDGGTALSACIDGRVRLWDLSDGRLIRKFEGHADAATCVRFSPDQRFVLSGSADGTLRLWKLSSGECIRIIKACDEAVACASFSRDSQLCLSGGADTVVRVWELSSGKCLHELKGHDGPVTSVCYHEKGFALSGSADWNYRITRNEAFTETSGISEDSLKLWVPVSGKFVRTIQPGVGDILTVHISPDGQRGLSGGVDGLVRLWDLENGKCARVLKGHTGAVTRVRFLPGGKTAVTGGDKTVRIWDLQKGKCLRTFEDHADEVLSICPDGAGRRCLSASRDRSLLLRRIQFEPGSPPLDLSRIKEFKDLKSERKQCRILAKRASRYLKKNDVSHALRELRAGRAIPGFERDSALLGLWHEAAGKARRTGLKTAWIARELKEHKDSVNCVAASPDGRCFLSGSSDKSMALWDIASGKCIRWFRWYKLAVKSAYHSEMSGRTDSVYSVAFSPDGRTGVSGGYFKTVLLWDLTTGKCNRILEKHLDAVTSVSIAPNSRIALSASRDGTAKLWNLLTGEVYKVLKGHEGHVACSAITPDGYACITAGDDSVIRLWEISTGKELFVLEGHAGRVNALSVSPDGRMALSGDREGAIRLWRLADAKSVLTLKKTPGAVESLAFSPEGVFAASAHGKQILIWNLASGDCIRTLEGHTGAVRSVAITPDGRYVISGGSDRIIVLWELDWEIAPAGAAKHIADHYGIDMSIPFDKACEPERTKYAASKSNKSGILDRLNPFKSKS